MLLGDPCPLPAAFSWESPRSYSETQRSASLHVSAYRSSIAPHSINRIRRSGLAHTLPGAPSLQHFKGQYGDIVDDLCVSAPILQFFHQGTDKALKRFAVQTFNGFKQPRGTEHFSVRAQRVRQAVGVEENTVARFKLNRSLLKIDAIGGHADGSPFDIEHARRCPPALMQQRRVPCTRKLNRPRFEIQYAICQGEELSSLLSAKLPVKLSGDLARFPTANRGAVRASLE